MNRTLVLNKHWTPVKIVTCYDSIAKMCKESAKALDPETYETFGIEEWLDRSMTIGELLDNHKVIVTPSMLIEKPEIVILNLYGGIPRIEVPLNRRNLIRRDGGVCQYCNKNFGTNLLSIDHIIPRSKGGAHTWENCVISCKKCNSKKSDKLLRECGMKLTKRPRRPMWLPIMADVPKVYPDSWDKFLGSRR